MRNAVAMFARFSVNLVIVITLIVLVVGVVIIQFTPLPASLLDATFRIMLLVVLLELLGLAILIHQKVSILSKPSGLEYVKSSDIPNPVDTARSVGATRVYACASSMGKTNKDISALLDNTAAEVHVFSCPCETPHLVPANIHEAQGARDLLFNNYRDNPRLHLWTTDNPPSIGFQAFCDDDDNVKALFLNWYTFYDGYTIMRGRGQNGGLVVRRGVSSDADALLDWTKDEIIRKDKDKTKKGVHAADSTG